MKRILAAVAIGAAVVGLSSCGFSVDSGPACESGHYENQYGPSVGINPANGQTTIVNTWQTVWVCDKYASDSPSNS